MMTPVFRMMAAETGRAHSPPLDSPGAVCSSPDDDGLVLGVWPAKGRLEFPGMCTTFAD